MQPLYLNASDLDLIRRRQRLAESYGGTLDGKRPAAWAEYGYKETLCFTDYLNAYERGGPAFGAVHKILDKCWQSLPRIKRPEADEESPWEKGVSKLMHGIKAWTKIRDFDRRNLVGVYAGLIYRVADGKMLAEPLEKASRLVDIVPVSEDQLRVTQWHTDERDADTYGKPKLFQYRARRPTATDTQGQPDQWVDVHPSRVQLLAEGAVGDDFFGGVPLLRAGFNSLVDLEKISGGSAESFLKNSSRVLVFEFEKGVTPTVISSNNADGTVSTRSTAEVLEEKTDALNRSIDKSIMIGGGKATTLQTDIADPRGAWETAANNFAAAVQIPFTILFGQQTGRLASDEDQDDFNNRCTSRRDNLLTPAVEEFVRRMQACGVIEAGEFEVEWEALDSPGEDDQADLLGKYTTAMKQAFDAGLTEPLFDANELRRVVGFEEREDDGMPEEGDPAADPLAQGAPGLQPVPIRPAA
jgi:hypothetical protein